MGKKIKIQSGSVIVITGGGGYLGSQLLKSIYTSDINIYVLDLKFNSLSLDFINKYLNVTKIEVDLTNLDGLKKITQNICPDFIFHFAGALNRARDFANYDKLYEINVKGTLNILMLWKDVNYRCFYFASTSEVYDTSVPVPFREDSPVNPSSPYSLTKLMAEQIIRTFSQIYNKPFIIFRIFNFYGPDLPVNTFIGELIFNIKTAKKFKMTRGEQKRDYLFIDDLIDRIGFVTESFFFKNEIINLCSGTSHSIIDILGLFREIYNMSVLQDEEYLEYRINEVWDNKGSVEKIVQFGYSMKDISLMDGIKRSLDRSE